MREKLLINSLIREEYVGIKKLQEILDISDRTIRTEIKLINEQGEQYGFKIINTRGKGYRLTIEDKEGFKEYLDKVEEMSLYGAYIKKDERIAKITKIILESNDFITIDEIAKKLSYSRSTVINDLVEVYKNLENLGIEFEKKSRFGTRIVTEEEKVRKYLAKNYYKQNNLLKRTEDEELFIRISEIFIKELIEKRIELSNIAIENIFFHLKILMFRVKQENYIKTKYTNINDGKFSIFIDITRRILLEIEKEFNIEIPEEEVLFMASQIYYKAELYREETLDKEKILQDIKVLLEEIDREEGTKLIEDKSLEDSLLMHLCALIGRVRQGGQIKNPYFEEINTKYPEVMLITLEFIGEFKKIWNLEIIEDEIGFVAMHFIAHFERIKNSSIEKGQKIGILCASEGGLSILLKLKIETALKGVKVDILNYRDSLDMYDVVVSNINFISRKNIIEIADIFDEKEIREAIGEIEKLIKVEKEETIEEIFFKVKEERENYIEFLKNEADIFSSKGLVEKNFKEEVLLREESISTAYKNGVAAPHSIKMNGLKNTIAITIFKKPIEWNGKEVDLVFFISLKNGSLNLHRKIGRLIFRITKDNDLKKKIMEAKNREEIRELIEL